MLSEFARNKFNISIKELESERGSKTLIKMIFKHPTIFNFFR